MEDSFGNLNLRPYLQRAWNLMNETYSIPGAGYFSLHPKKLRMQSIYAQNDLLNIKIGITAAPVVSFARTATVASPVPDLSTAYNPGGFSIYLEGALQYDSLSNLMNGYLAGKRFDVNEGLFKKHIIIRNTVVSGDTSGHLVIRMDFTGSFEGTVYLTGQPLTMKKRKLLRSTAWTTT
jgi:hypothetical protein